ncbi:MAG: cytochrome c oxidase subunit 3 [Luteolibacter sp.]
MTQEKLPPPSALLYPPGGLLIWSLVLMELLTFGVALIAFVISGRSEPEIFQAGREHLNSYFGVANTVFLLASGYFMAAAVERFKKGTNARPLIHCAMVGGILFLVLKGIEYHEKIESGLTLGHDTFLTYYWLLTVFHLMHVLVGLIILAVLHRRLRPAAKTMQPEDFEAGAVFWHMCDLIWLILFPVIYLLP